MILLAVTYLPPAAQSLATAYNQVEQGLLARANRKRIKAEMEKEKWFDYAINQSLAWGVPCIILVYAKTDTKWWDKFVTQNDFVKVHFQIGRIRFWKNGKPGPAPAPYGNAWLVINP